MKILTLSTYPARDPKHGGQKRVRALRTLYEKLDCTVEAVSVYSSHYKKNDIGRYDLPLGFGSEIWEGVPFVEDIQAGEFAARSPAAYEHFVRVMTEVAPNIVVLEHPFMLPLLRRLRSDGLLKAHLIYSSHNWEPPLKEAILIRHGVERHKVDVVVRAIEQLEREALEMSHLVLAVSAQDAAIYRSLSPTSTILVAPNGVDRFPNDVPYDNELLWHFGGRRYLFFVGSAYPPNIEGFNNLVAESGLFFRPPIKSVAVCGGVCESIFQSHTYQTFAAANGERVQFFPNLSDEDLNKIQLHSHAVLLPIQFGGGSNLKTAEALCSGKWVVTTSLALRGFEAFAKVKGVLVANTPQEFRHAMVKVLGEEPLSLTKAQRAQRDVLVWDRALALSGAEAGIGQFVKQVAALKS